MPRNQPTLPNVEREIVDENRVQQSADAVIWDRWLELLREAVGAVDRKDLLFRLDLQNSQLSEALKETGGKHFHLRWLVVLGDLLPPGELRVRVAAAIAAQFGCAVEPFREMTVEDELAELRAAVRSEFGTAGDRLLATRGNRRGRRG